MSELILYESADSNYESSDEELNTSKMKQDYSYIRKMLVSKNKTDRRLLKNIRISQRDRRAQYRS